MKKILLALALAASCHLSHADVPAAFAQVQSLIEAKNLTGAYQELEKLAKAGHAEALYHQAYMLQIGQGVEKDDKKALKLFEQASKKGVAPASYILAQHYLSGTLGLKSNIAKGKSYLETAEKQGFKNATIDLAMLILSEGTPASEKTGLAKLEPLVKAKHPQAQYAQAMYYISSGIQAKNEKTVQQGLTGIEALASKGYVPALMSVATMFIQGNLVDQNLPEAKKILTELSKAKVPQAQSALDSVNKMLEKQVKKS